MGKTPDLIKAGSLLFTPWSHCELTNDYVASLLPSHLETSGYRMIVWLYHQSWVTWSLLLITTLTHCYILSYHSAILSLMVRLAYNSYHIFTAQWPLSFIIMIINYCLCNIKWRQKSTGALARKKYADICYSPILVLIWIQLLILSKALKLDL